MITQRILQLKSRIKIKLNSNIYSVLTGDFLLAAVRSDIVISDK